MIICYPCCLSIFLLIISVVDGATLHVSTKGSFNRRNQTSIITDDVSTSEPILSRRRPLLPSMERGRWLRAAAAYNDEEEIPIEPPSSSPVKETTADISNVTEEQTTLGNSITTVNEITSPVEDSTNTTEPSVVDSTTEQNQQNNDTTTLPNTEPLVIRETTIDSRIFTADVPQNNETIAVSSGTEPSATTEQLVSTTEQIVSSPMVTVTENQENSTASPAQFTTIVVEEISNSSFIDTTGNEASTPMIEVTTYTTAAPSSISEETFPSVTTVSNETIEEDYSNETTIAAAVVRPISICDRSCQCNKKCPYGFEIVDEQCRCDPPCKNYECFGNDTCTVTGTGRPVCQPQNGTKHDRPQRCYQPQVAGYHEEIVRYDERWYYHPDQDTCHMFVYRGSGGNENNFQSRHQCELECITCGAAPDRGGCSSSIPMWFYDHKTRQCSEFRYSGCKGNDNRFYREQVCLDTCVTRILNL